MATTAKKATPHQADTHPDIIRVELKRKEEGYPGDVQVLTLRVPDTVAASYPQAADMVREWIDHTGWRWRTDRLPIHLRVEWSGTEPRMGEQRGVETYLAAKGFPIHGSSFHRF